MPNSFLPSSTPLSVQLEYQSAAIPFPRLLGNFPVQILTMFEEYQSVKADGKSCWLRWLWSLGAPPSALHHPGQAAASDTPMSGLRSPLECQVSLCTALRQCGMLQVSWKRLVPFHCTGPLRTMNILRLTYLVLRPLKICAEDVYSL